MNEEILVEYSDETKETYNTIKEAEAGILEKVTDSNFEVLVDNITVGDEENGNHLSCEWSVKLVD